MTRKLNKQPLEQRIDKSISCDVLNRSAFKVGDSIRVPMLGDFTILYAKHIEFKLLMVLTVTARPSLPHVDDNHVTLGDHVQQLAFVVWRQLLSEALAKRVHESFKSTAT